MEQIDRNIGKELVYDYYQVGSWYMFKVSLAGAIKYMRCDKIYEGKDTSRSFIKGIGFIVKDGALYTPNIAKEEPIVYVWAKDKLKENVEIPEDEIKEIYRSAMEKSYNNMFN